MENELTSRDKERIEESIRGKYAKVAVSPEGLFRYPTGLAGLRTLNYDPNNHPNPTGEYNGLLLWCGKPFCFGTDSQGRGGLGYGTIKYIALGWDALQ